MSDKHDAHALARALPSAWSSSHAPPALSPFVKVARVYRAGLGAPRGDTATWRHPPPSAPPSLAPPSRRCLCVDLLYRSADPWTWVTKNPQVFITCSCGKMGRVGCFFFFPLKENNPKHVLRVWGGLRRGPLYSQAHLSLGCSPSGIV